MFTSARRATAPPLLVLSALVSALLCDACATRDVGSEGADPPAVAVEPPIRQNEPPESMHEEGHAEVPLSVAESEHREAPPPADGRDEVIVQARGRGQVIHDLVAEAQALLSNVNLEYAFTGTGGGRRCADALWSSLFGAKRRKNGRLRALRSPVRRSSGNRWKTATVPAAHTQTAGATRKGYRRRAPHVHVRAGWRSTEGLRTEGFRFSTMTL